MMKVSKTNMADQQAYNVQTSHRIYMLPLLNHRGPLQLIFGDARICKHVLCTVVERVLCLFISCCVATLKWAMASSFLKFLDHTHTDDITPLDE